MFPHISSRFHGTRRYAIGTMPSGMRAYSRPVPLALPPRRRRSISMRHITTTTLVACRAEPHVDALLRCAPQEAFRRLLIKCRWYAVEYIIIGDDAAA